MDAPAAEKPTKINRWLPYWAVFQEDIRQTLRSWVYRTWVLVSVLAAVGFLLYRVGVFREAGMVQFASHLTSDLLRWTLLGSVTLIIVMTASSISGDRGTLADSVLCRGISRYQYFFAKWHSRLVTILATFFGLGVGLLLSSYFLLQDDLSLIGCVVTLLTVAVLLATVITCGVTVSAITSSTVMGITVLWLAVYGIGFLLSLLPARFPSPEQVLTRLPHMLRGAYDMQYLGQLGTWSLGVSVVAAVIGLAWFARRDV
jgi:ABC-type transport system involved in multi-copper enzyme maturation permease subunit